METGVGDDKVCDVFVTLPKLAVVLVTCVEGDGAPPPFSPKLTGGGPGMVKEIGESV
jgi:hypothetical protein